jgi:hypothetical protein
MNPDKTSNINLISISDRPYKRPSSIEEVAYFFRKSKSWVYKNWKLLGGKKLEGSLVFPILEDLYEHIFGKRQGVAVRFPEKQGSVLGSMVQDQGTSENSRIGQEKGVDQRGRKRSSRDDKRGIGGSSDAAPGINATSRYNTDPARHGL